MFLKSEPSIATCESFEEIAPPNSASISEKLLLAILELQVFDKLTAPPLPVVFILSKEESLTSTDVQPSQLIANPPAPPDSELVLFLNKVPSETFKSEFRTEMKLLPEPFRNYES